MTGPEHARRGPLSRLAGLLHHDDARPQRPAAYTGKPGTFLPGLPFAAEVKREAPASPATAMRRAAPHAQVDGEPHGIATPATLAAIVAEAEAEARRNSTPPARHEDPLRYEHQAWYGWFTTMPDNRAPMARRYVPEPPAYTPDLCADLADLPAFREALDRRTRCRAGECLCGHPLTGDTWGERMVRAGIHLLASKGEAA